MLLYTEVVKNQDFVADTLAIIQLAGFINNIDIL